jgi:chromosome segregation ATPase
VVGSGGTGSGGIWRQDPTDFGAVAAAPAQRGGWLPGIVGGVVGAALAAFGAPLLQGPPDLSPEAQSRVASIESNTSAITDRLAALEGELTPIAERVAGLEAFTDEMEPTVQAAVEAAVAEVPSQDGAAIAALAEEVEGLAATTEQLQTAAAEAVDPLPLIEAQGERLDQIAASLEAFEGRLGEEAERSDALAGSLEQRVAALDADVAGRLETLRETARGEIGEAEAALISEIEALRGALADTATVLASIEGDVTALQQARSRAAAAALLDARDRSIDRERHAFAEPLERLIPMAERRLRPSRRR